MPEMENPKTSRSTAKGKLTRIEKYVNEDTIEKNINDLTIRLNALENIIKDFDKAQAGVESMPGIELPDEEDERDSFEGLQKLTLLFRKLKIRNRRSQQVHLSVRYQIQIAMIL
ncbi:hypothetical protein MTP99_013060 [Tenebrio molitor]|jgi:hypothetical protein|nr:hypothetical protein MTP99_013060 [Tenebrio molitor]